ncbi:PREDICTED: transcription repressor OFP6-like [Ipomoea nil]|uniref:transcription repressor OFP6-like n=1 Tax=Ipomoea nil TaxID=35883 RepID=UPI0009019C30|nr:PREDICTED: transcription repressor OFP6-like [Ipomoea nil]
MSSHDKKKIILSSVAVKLGCGGGSCRRPKLSAVFQPKPRRHHKTTTTFRRSYSGVAAANGSNYSSSSWDTTTTTFSPAYASSDTDSEIKSLRAVQGFGRIGGESVAVEKDSDDPYLDFRHSMLQMILEKNIYSKDDLKELLNCFLQLNSPYYHGVIVRAFTEIWNGVFSVKPPVAATFTTGGASMSRGF